MSMGDPVQTSPGEVELKPKFCPRRSWMEKVKCPRWVGSTSPHKLCPRESGRECIMCQQESTKKQMCPIVCARELETNHILGVKSQFLTVQGGVA